jgi:UDP-4-amino-4,6-dideoxy-N-acetyl-beta-L-altrosamine transaminase
MIPYGRQSITQADIDAVVDVLRSDYLTQGPMVPRFEAEIVARCDVREAVAMNSATSVLHAACLALGVGPGDRVWTSPISFVASSNCALYCGARVDFVDIDDRTFNLSPDRLAERLAAAESDGTLPKVLIPVHHSGQSCEMDRIHSLATRYGIRIIEDASHAIGGRYRGEPVGNCRYSDITVFSFHPVKIITTAEGGVATTNDPALAARLALLRTHGITRDPALMTHPSDGPWYYQQIELGFNYRMTDLQAALGVSQIQRLEEFVARRHALAARYEELLADLPIDTPWQHPDTHSALHLYVVRLRLDRIEADHRAVFERLRASGIGVNLHYIPIYRQPYYRELGFRDTALPAAERYYAEAISLPMYATLTDGDQDQVAKAVRGAIAS